MKKMMLLIATLTTASMANAELLCSQPQNYARCNTLATTELTFTPFIITTAISSAFKIIVDAKEDAAAFIATEGEVRTAAFENAVNFVRTANPQAEVSDFEIASAILSVQ